jgi:hypothetical protein
MKYRFRTGIEIIVEGKDKEQAQERFEELDLGSLDSEQKKTNIDRWDYIDVDYIQEVNDDGTVGAEV